MSATVEARRWWWPKPFFDDTTVDTAARAAAANTAAAADAAGNVEAAARPPLRQLADQARTAAFVEGPGSRFAARSAQLCRQTPGCGHLADEARAT